MFEIILPAGNYVVAVSGGVDSVVLLDVLSRLPDVNLIVAHFDHGIRVDSEDDKRFVEQLAGEYGLVVESKRENLGEEASEELARDRRYAFLRSIAEKYQAKLVTAHHADDVIETIAINLFRGTGWRGLAVLDSDAIRPMAGVFKSEVLNYAKQHQLSWHEDSTNSSDKYLRNRIRERLRFYGDDDKLQLLALWRQQKYLKQQIDDVVKQIVKKADTYDRDMFNNVSKDVALECLRYMVDARLTRPQLKYLLNRINTSLPGKICQAGDGINVKFSSRNFRI